MTPGLRARVRLFGARSRDDTRKSSRVERSRAALAFGAVAMLIATIGMSAAVETVKPEWRDPEFGHRLARLRQLERDTPGRPLVIVLGTSRAQNAFDPSVMGFSDQTGSPRLFNFGQSAAPPIKVLLTLLRLLDEGIRPSAVVVEVLPLWLMTDGAAENQLREAAPRLAAGDLRRLAPYSANPSVLGTRWVEARAAPWYSQRVVLMSHWSPRWLSWRERIDPQWDGMEPDGFVPFPPQFATPEFRVEATARARREYAGAFAGFRFGDASVRALGDLVARCRADGIAIAFVEPPVSPQFRGWFHDGVWTSGEERLHALARELGVELIPPYAGLAEPDFIDGHHLLRDGAEKYSRWLGETHLKAWLQRERSKQ